MGWSTAAAAETFGPPRAILLPVSRAACVTAQARRSCRPRRGAGGRNACKARRRGVHGSAAYFSPAQSCGIASDLCRRRVCRRPWLSSNVHARPCAVYRRKIHKARDRAGVLPYRTWDIGPGRGARRSAAGSVSDCVCAPSRGLCTASAPRLCASRPARVRPCDASPRRAHTGCDRARVAPSHISDINSGRGTRRYDAGSLRVRAQARCQDSCMPSSSPCRG